MKRLLLRRQQGVGPELVEQQERVKIRIYPATMTHGLRPERLDQMWHEQSKPTDVIVRWQRRYRGDQRRPLGVAGRGCNQLNGPRWH